MNRKVIIYLCAAIVSIALILLLSGSSVLVIGLDPDDTIPAGTFITWFGLIALSVLVFQSRPRLRKPTTGSERFFSLLAKFFIVLAILWVPVSYLLSGNLRFNFIGAQTYQGGYYGMKTFWNYTFLTAVGPIATYLLSWTVGFFKK
jgi:hypothetical protein